MNEPRELDELDIREWFMKADLTEAIATHNVVQGILSMRQLQQPQRKRRKDAGVKRTEEQPTMFDKERKA